MEGTAWIGLAAALSSWNFFNSALCITSSGDFEIATSRQRQQQGNAGKQEALQAARGYSDNELGLFILCLLHIA